MGKASLHIIFLLFCMLDFCTGVSAQVTPVADTFFLAKKKGLLGRIGKSLVKSPESEDPVKIATPFLRFSGRTIRSIEVFPLGFDQEIDDTAVIKKNLAISIANRLHRNTRISVIRNYLFFRKGDKLKPLLLSDNEIFLRNQPFLKDALIIAVDDDVSDSVDIVVLTRDVFSIGGNINANTNRVIAEVREENVEGTGNEILVSGIYDKDRKQRAGIGAEMLLRNIKGTFLNLTAGYSSFNRAYNSSRNEEQYAYLQLEKPFVNRYSKWTAFFNLSVHKNANRYISDSLFKSDFRYNYTNADLWAGYSLGYLYNKGSDSYKHLRHIVAARTFYLNFDRVPDIFNGIFRFDYASINGFLFSYSVYRQNFYRTNYIYAFGRNEDVPSGLSASIIAGWTNKENRKRPYYGFEFEGSRFSKKSIYSYYTMKAGSSYKDGKLEDIDLLFSVEHFTRLRKLAPKWRNRNFIYFSFTRKFNYEINTPLFLKSDFGLPYFQNGNIKADERFTLKLETDFYNLDKILGFRLAPFAFSDFCFLKPVNQPLAKTDGFTAFGGGLRARNENLIFGTIELKGLYFPRTIGSMKNFRIEVVSKVRFRFNTNFIRKPDFIRTN